MSSYQWGRLIGQILGHVVMVSLRVGYKAVMLFCRLAAQGTAMAIPAATSMGGAIGQAVLAGAAWALAIGLLSLLSGHGTVIRLGFSFGALVGCLVAFSLVDRGRAEVKVASGGIEVGELQGTLGVTRPHVIARASRVRHVAVFGSTGAGKSTVIKNLIRQDAAAPGQFGILCVDVKDDVVLDVAAHLPPSRVDDVLLFDPADTGFPPAFNPLADVPAESRTLAAAELLSAIKRLYAESWGPRLEHVLRQVLLTLLETPDATLLDITRVLTDHDYRSWAVGHVSNFSVTGFWEREFPSIAGRNGSLGNVESILNKLGVLSYPEVRNVLGQRRRGLDLRAAMDSGKIVLAHLPQGVLGEDASHFLGALLIGKVQLAAQSRVNLGHAQRKPFYVFADEFQNYETSAFDKLITEGRSMGVGLVAACQYREQLPQQLRLSLERNCAYALNCRLVNNRHTVAVIKLQEPEAPDAAMLVRPLPPPSEAVPHQRVQIRDQSRQALAQPRATVEREIAARREGVAAAPSRRRPVTPSTSHERARPSNRSRTAHERPVKVDEPDLAPVEELYEPFD